MSDGYSLFQSGGAWFCRWSEYRNGKRVQPSHRLGSVKDFPKKVEAAAEASRYMERVCKTQTVSGERARFRRADILPGCGTAACQAYCEDLPPILAKATTLPRTLELRDVGTMHVQQALDAVHEQYRDTLSHKVYRHVKVSISAVLSEAVRLGAHPGPNPVRDATIRKNWGHYDHRENGAYSLAEVRQFLQLFPSGPTAIAIASNAFLALRRPEIEALVPEDFDLANSRIRIWKGTKTRNSEYLPIVEPLKRILSDGFQPIRLRNASRAIRKRIKGTNLPWLGFYAFRRGMATNLFELGFPPEVACLILRNTADVVRAHYLKLKKEKQKVDAMGRVEQAYEETDCTNPGAHPTDCAMTVQ